MDTIDVVVETPAGSANKYEWDAEAQRLRLDRRMSTAVSFPADYGFVPGTRASDGDALDAIVLLAAPSIPGCIVCARPIGVLWLDFDGRGEPKVITVLDGDPRFDDVHHVDDLPPALRDELVHFFMVYKLLEPGSDASTPRFTGPGDALRQVEEARAACTGAGAM